MLAIIEFILNRLIPLLKKHKVEEFHLTLLLIYVLFLMFQFHKVVQITERVSTIIRLQLCMPILLLAISSFFFLWLRDKPKFDKFLNIYWDKNNNMHCSSCKKLLAPSFIGNQLKDSDKSVFQCNFCNKKTILKMDDGTPISKAEAINKKIT